MNFRVNILPVFILLGLCSTVRSQEKITIGVMDFAAKSGFEQDKADVLLDILAEKISSMGDVTVITRTDVMAILVSDKQRRLLGCEDDACVLEEIGGALGMKWMVTGNVSRLGGTYRINLKLFDMRTSQVVSRVSGKTSGNEDDLVEELLDATYELFERAVDYIQLVPNVTVAARHTQAVGMSPSAITVITREDIEASGANRLSDLLRLVPGLEINYVSSVFSSITGRLVWGYTNNTFLGLLDGREINLELMGQALWELQPIALEDIERIEVLKGPGSSLYGANAQAGVISITTRKIVEEPHGSVRLAAGEPGVVKLNGKLSYRVGDLGLSLGGGLDNSESFAAPEALPREVYKLRGVAHYKWSDNQGITLDASLVDATGPVTTGVMDVNMEAFFTHLHLACKTESLEGQLSWSTFDLDSQEVIPLNYADLNLAYFTRQSLWAHLLDSKVQWSLPTIWDPLLVIAGGRMRGSWIGVETGLDADTYLNPNSSHYLEKGLYAFELRTGVYLHAEYTPLDWLTLTSGGRWDYNNVSGMILSPRIAGVLRPADGQYIRIGYAQSFRMPSFFESTLHFGVDFPEDSPFRSESQKSAFREFATKIMGNPEVDDEIVKAFEIGYRGAYLDGNLSVSIDLFYGLLQNQIILGSSIRLDDSGLPDLRNSSVLFENCPEEDRKILGGELTVSYRPARNYTLVASWSHREVFYDGSGRFDNGSPKNYLTLGGRFLTDWGLVGSLFVFTRSEFTDYYVASPEGVMESAHSVPMPNLMLLMGRLGQRWEYGPVLKLEAGIKLLLPLELSKGSGRFFEKGGGETVFGQHYGADELRQAVTGYLQGSF